ncbi:ankyrin repeat domain-containing protein [Aspergillus glaucus CBS 516.65]|uniref:Uncharacterized protein n=1 Tax=Aspergillus glaucus CBS 516.65 TaxID=1160497 RepID=A0A1L9VJI5_ASPGL|nr:hypothetical protein ASPGLDRAFT_36031 [Aspergillus glaucus CBS 516.65]OJJ84035.1 hypothetical protein ASPGLDRAFT_36031 [Aspergillus glaucus CBS 516.65]
MPKPKPTTTIERTPCLLLQCPSEIIIEVASYLELSHLYAFVQTSRALYATLRIPFYNRACTTSIRSYNRSSASVLEWASGKGYVAVIWEIRTQESPGDWRKSPPQAKNIALCLAAANGHLACIEPLLAMGAYAGMTCQFSQSEWSKWPEYYTPIQYAAENGHPAMVELLLTKGAVPGTLMGMKALENSILNNLKACTYFLLDHGVSTRVEAPVVAKTYLIEKASEGCQGMVRTLVENGVNIFTNNSDDHAAVQYAIGHGRVKCLRNLLEGQAIFGSEIVLHTAVMQMNEIAT